MTASVGIDKPSSWKWPVKWLMLLAGVFPLLAWLQTTGNPLLYLDPATPPGQWAYVLSKLLGLYAIFFLAIQIVAGLVLRKGNHSIHRYTGCLVITLMLLHGLLFVVAVSIRSGHIAWPLLLPTFSSGYYKGALALGVLGLWFSFFLVYAGVRLAAGNRSWKRAHWLSLPIFAATFAHGWMIGTESQGGIYQLIYYILAASVFVALLIRLTSVVFDAFNIVIHRQSNL